MAEVRLQKFLAECGVGSRRKMEQFITQGRVRVNDQVVTDLGRKINPDVDRVEVNRRPVHAAPKGIIVFNKPRGVVSTLSDPEGRRSIADFLTKKYASYFPVGRLDWDSTGLMVLTNDGEIAERLMHPRFGFERVYHARVEGSVGDVVLGKIARGIRLSDGIVRAKASIMSNDDNTTWVEVKLSEGRNRVVRRLFDKVGHPVIKLKRVVYGPFKLGRLQVGQMRALTLKEYDQARRKVMTFKPGEAEEVENDRPHVSQERERSFDREPRRGRERSAGRDDARRGGRFERRDGRSDDRRNGRRDDRQDERRWENRSERSRDEFTAERPRRVGSRDERGGSERRGGRDRRSGEQGRSRMSPSRASKAEREERSSGSGARSRFNRGGKRPAAPRGRSRGK